MTSVLEKCLRFTKPSWWSYSCLARDTFPKPKSCKTPFLTTKAFSLFWFWRKWNCKHRRIVFWTKLDLNENEGLFVTLPGWYKFIFYHFYVLIVRIKHLDKAKWMCSINSRPNFWTLIKKSYPNFYQPPSHNGRNLQFLSKNYNPFLPSKSEEIWFK